MKKKTFGIARMKRRLSGFSRTLAERSFLTFLALFAVSLIFGGAVYYQYGVLAEKKEPSSTARPIKFEEKTYEEVLKIWQEREREFQESGLKERLDPFSPGLSLWDD